MSSQRRSKNRSLFVLTMCSFYMALNEQVSFLSSLERERVPEQATTPSIVTQEEEYPTSCRIGNKTVIFPNQFPKFIIVGAQKAGTTAVAELLKQVPNFVGTIKKEPHFWDRIRVPRRRLSLEEQCKMKQRYLRCWDVPMAMKQTTTTTPSQQLVLFEKTPSLLTMPSVPGNIVKVLRPYKPKIIIILRDPVTRAYSNHKMAWQFSGTARAKGTFPTFDQSVESNVNALKKAGIIKAPPFYANYSSNNETTMQQQRWNPQDFSNLGVSPRHYHGGIIERAFYVNQIRNFMKNFTLGESLLVLHYETLNEYKAQTLNEILRFVGVPPHNMTEETLNRNMSPNNKYRYYPPMSNETRDYLKLLYKPFNDELADLLGESWRGVWD